MALIQEQEKPSPDIYIPQEWSDAADSFAYDSTTSPPPIAFICGAKNSGKTTFSRHLLNILLHRYKRVAYLDTDVGQPEFTPPGFLSLTIVDKLTPDLTIPCLKTPERSFFFGDVSSKRDPTAYLTYISTLYDHYKKEYCTSNNTEGSNKTELPLVVNTPGWVKGVGYDLLVNMLKYIAPTHVVKINISAQSKNLPDGAFWLDGNKEVMVNLIEISSAREDSFKRSVLVQKDAHLLRDLRIMAYFRQCFPSNLNITTIKELAQALASQPPYEVPIASIKIRHLYCQIPSTEIYYSLNATIVGLAVSSEGSGNSPWCVGLGIVRGVDTFKGLLYVITPVPPSTLEKVDLFLQGFIQIPTGLLQESISPHGGFSYDSRCIKIWIFSPDLAHKNNVFRITNMTDTSISEYIYTAPSELTFRAVYHHTCRQMFCLEAELYAVVCYKRNFLPDSFHYSYSTEAVKKLCKN